MFVRVVFCVVCFVGLLCILLSIHVRYASSSSYKYQRQHGDVSPLLVITQCIQRMQAHIHTHAHTHLNTQLHILLASAKHGVENVHTHLGTHTSTRSWRPSLLSWMLGAKPPSSPTLHASCVCVCACVCYIDTLVVYAHTRTHEHSRSYG